MCKTLVYKLHEGTDFHLLFYYTFQYLNTTWNTNEHPMLYFKWKSEKNKCIPGTQKLFNNSKSINVFCHINWLKKNTHMITLIGAMKTFDKFYSSIKKNILTKNLKIDRTYNNKGRNKSNTNLQELNKEIFNMLLKMIFFKKKKNFHKHNFKMKYVEVFCCFFFLCTYFPWRTVEVSINLERYKWPSLIKVHYSL